MISFTQLTKVQVSINRSIMSNSLRPCGLQPTKLLCPWSFPGKNTGVGCHALLQEIFPTQGSNLGLLHCKTDSLPSELPGKSTQLTYLKANPHGETPSQIGPEIMFHLLSEHPLAQLHKINTSHTFNSFRDPDNLLDLHFLIC